MPIFTDMTRKNRGFTLIELLVVISIITLLLAILLPALQKSRQAAQSIGCLSNMKQMSVCITVYLNEYRETFPPYKVNVSTPSGGRYYWNDMLKRYINEPVPMPGVSQSTWFQDSAPVPQAFKCTSLTADDSSSTAFSGIGYSNYALGQEIWANNWKRLNNIMQPGKLLVIADAQIKRTWSDNRIVGCNKLNDGSYASYRHPSDTANAFFADGHGRTTRFEELGSGWSTFYKKYPWMEP